MIRAIQLIIVLLLISSIGECQWYIAKRYENPLGKALELRREGIISLSIGTPLIIGGIVMINHSNPEEWGDNLEVMGGFCLFAGSIIDVTGLSRFVVNQSRINKIKKVVACKDLNLGVFNHSSKIIPAGLRFTPAPLISLTFYF